MVTTGRLKKSSGKRKNAGSISPATMAKARALAEQYRIVIWVEDEWFYGRALELSYAMGDGATPDGCVASTREAIVILLACMLADGLPLPPPASENVRTEQVNLRLTVEEKTSLEVAASRSGADGISDFVRTAALAAAGRN